MNLIKSYGPIAISVFCAFFLIIAMAAERKEVNTFTAVDDAGIIWQLQEEKNHIVVSRTYPNETVITAFSSEVMCNRLESDTQAVVTMDLEIDEIYFLFHRHIDKVTNKVNWRIQISMNKRSSLSMLKDVTGDLCVAN